MQKNILYICHQTPPCIIALAGDIIIKIMKKISYFLAAAAIASMLSCGSSDEQAAEDASTHDAATQELLEKAADNIQSGSEGESGKDTAANNTSSEAGAQQ